MTTSTVGTKTLVVSLLAVLAGHAGTTLTAWTPLFQGADRAVGTNTPGGGTLQNRQVAYFVRVDLREPEVRLFSSPRMANYVPNAAETPGYTVSTFLRTNRLQVAINANYFDPQEYYLPAGTPMDISGLSICEGTVVSAQTSAANAATLLVTQDNQARIVHTNWPPVATTGIYTAVAGMYPILVNGVNIGYRYLNDSDFVHQVNPRTAIGLSQDHRYLFLLAIDGRQSGYSVGAYDWETAGWLLLAGAYDGINMDGGGSTTLVMQDSTGAPVRINKPSAVADSGRERTVGSHFGVFARPVRGFINDVVAMPDDTTAVITWNTTAPATSQVQYGVTSDLPLLTAPTATLLTNHSVLLRELAPATGYYFRALSQADGREYASSNLVFTTTNYVTAGPLFELDHPWTFTVGNLDGVSWTDPAYDDTSWTGSGPGLLWVDTRATGPLPEVQPRNTEMPANPDNNGFPYITYYLRTHFSFPDNVAGVSLILSNYLDDGAVFYLNGAEVQRLYLPPAPTDIAHDTLAEDYFCEGGNATCPLVFTLPDAAANLRTGDNVLAVEVHNYSLHSPDVTFGCALHYTQPAPRQPVLSVQRSPDGVTLSWDRHGFTLQSGTEPLGPWADVPGPVTDSPYTVTPAAAAAYYRLRQ
jgi:hypothetical protein